MKKVWIYLLMVTALVIGAAFVACGGDEGKDAADATKQPATEQGGGEELDLAEYLQQFEAIRSASKARFQTLREEAPSGVGQEVQATRDYQDSLNSATEDLLADLKPLRPPAEARDAHDELIAALTEWLALLEGVSDRLAEIESPDELEALNTEVEGDQSLSALEDRVVTACLQVQAIADGNGIEVDLACE